MQPRQYKQLAEILLVIGIAVAAVGVAVMYGLNERTIGAALMLIGGAAALLSLPTFMILMLFTANSKK